MSRFKPGDRVRVLHDCWGDHTIGGDTGTRHNEPITLDSIHDGAVLGTLLGGFRCDGTRIEWIQDGTETLA